MDRESVILSDLALVQEKGIGNLIRNPSASTSKSAPLQCSFQFDRLPRLVIVKNVVISIKKEIQDKSLLSLIEMIHVLMHSYEAEKSSSFVVSHDWFTSLTSYLGLE